MSKCLKCGYDPDEEKSLPGAVQPVVSSVIDAYMGVKKAIPRVSEHREKFLNRELTMEDVKAPPSKIKLVQQDNELRQFSYQGDSLFFGSGVENDI